MVDRHPLAIVRCADDDDVMKALTFARERNVPIAVRSGGHSIAGFGTCDGGIVIDLSKMKQISIDSESMTATAQPGLTWGEFDKATLEHGLATTGGECSQTGIGGVSLGGGIGWLARQYGLAIDNIMAVEMVLADGRRVRASPTENSDLFWGVRGGGGNFGIVTRLQYNLHRVGPQVFGGALFYPLERAKQVLAEFAKLAPGFPDELTIEPAFLVAPPEPFIPKEFVGTTMLGLAACYTGPMEEGGKLVSPFRELEPAVDILGPIPYVTLQSLFDAAVPRGKLNSWKSCYMRELGERAIDTLVSSAAQFPSPLSAILVFCPSGAVAKRKSGDSAYPHRDLPYLLLVDSVWTDSTETERNTSWVNRTLDGMKSFSAGGSYLGFLGAEGPQEVKAAYGSNYLRLVELKRKYDPMNIFRINQNISPT